MDGYQVSVACPRCGGTLEHQRSEIHADDHTSAECTCRSCGSRWRLNLTATLVEARDDAEQRRERARAAAAGSASGW